MRWDGVERIGSDWIESDRIESCCVVLGDSVSEEGREWATVTWCNVLLHFEVYCKVGIM